MNIIKMMIVALMVSVHCVTQSVGTEKTVNERLMERKKRECILHAGAGTSEATLSAVSGLYYYDTIVRPYVVELAQEKGLAHAIEFNKNFIMQHPEIAIMYAIPLFVSLVMAKWAYDDLNQAWQDKKSLDVCSSKK